MGASNIFVGPLLLQSGFCVGGVVGGFRHAPKKPTSEVVCVFCFLDTIITHQITTSLRKLSQKHKQQQQLKAKLTQQTLKQCLFVTLQTLSLSMLLGRIS